MTTPAFSSSMTNHRSWTWVRWCFAATTTDPSAAAVMVRESPKRFDLLITDLSMPVMNGIDLAAEAHAANGELPIILITGYGMTLSTEQLCRSGISAVLPKPYSAAQLAQAVNRALSTADPAWPKVA